MFLPYEEVEPLSLKFCLSFSEGLTRVHFHLEVSIPITKKDLIPVHLKGLALDVINEILIMPYKSIRTAVDWVIMLVVASTLRKWEINCTTASVTLFFRQSSKLNSSQLTMALKLFCRKPILGNSGSFRIVTPPFNTSTIGSQLETRHVFLSSFNSNLLQFPSHINIHVNE